MSVDETCPQIVVTDFSSWTRNSRPCGKPIKRDGLCGVHARAADLRVQRSERWAAEAQGRKEFAALARQLTDRFGVQFASDGRRITLDPEDAAELLATPPLQPEAGTQATG